MSTNTPNNERRSTAVTRVNTEQMNILGQVVILSTNQTIPFKLRNISFKGMSLGFKDFVEVREKTPVEVQFNHEDLAPVPGVLLWSKKVDSGSIAGLRVESDAEDKLREINQVIVNKLVRSTLF